MKIIEIGRKDVETKTIEQIKEEIKGKLTEAKNEQGEQLKKC